MNSGVFNRQYVLRLNNYVSNYPLKVCCAERIEVNKIIKELTNQIRKSLEEDKSFINVKVQYNILMMIIALNNIEIK